MPDTAEASTQGHSEQQKCAKCAGPLDRVADNNWCKKCWNAYQREYNATKEGRAEKKGFNQGREAMRKIICEEFAKLLTSQFDGATVYNLIARMPGPQFDSD